MILILYIFLYFVLPVATVFAAEVFLHNLKEGGIFHFWDKHILFHLRQRNSMFEKPLGGCDQCFTLWLSAFLSLCYLIPLMVHYHLSWGWYFLIPSYIFITLGLTACIFQFKKTKK